MRGRLTDRENGVAEPAHAQTAELLVEELDAELAGKQRNVLDDGQPDAPLLVLGELDNGREQRLGKEVDANDCSTVALVGTPGRRMTERRGIKGDTLARADQASRASVALTLVHELKLRDDVQPDLGELVLKHLQEHGEEVINGPVRGKPMSVRSPQFVSQPIASPTSFRQSNRVVRRTGGQGMKEELGYVLLLAEDGSQTRNLGAQGSANMLRAVRDKVLDAAHDLVEQCRPLDQSTEPGDLTSDRCPNLSLVVLEQLNEGGDQVPRDYLLVDCFCDL